MIETPGSPSEPFDWRTVEPASAGMDAGRLRALQEELARRQTKALLILRRDRIVWEWYAPGHGPEEPHYTASLAKALVGGMSLLLAMNDGRIGGDDLACTHVPAWVEDPLKSKITIRHLATHSSGIADAEEAGKSHEELTGWKGDFWKRAPDPFSIALHQAPVLFEPGSRFQYSNPGMAALAYAVTASLRGAPQSDLRSLLRDRIMEPIGVRSEEWSVGYGQTYVVDGLPLVANWGGGAFTARATARVGRLMLRGGDWEGEQLVEERLARQAVAYAGTPLPERTPGNPAPAPTLGWYSNSDSVWPSVPRDAFAGAGAGQQVLLVVPSLALIVVRNGGALGDEEGFWGGLQRYVFEPVMEAIRDRSAAAASPAGPPYPSSPVIREIVWAPKETIVRKAWDSDNWPVTWGEDDHLYTAYGDGRGFEPNVPEKLSLGFARVSGPPDDFTGVNIRSVTGEQKGNGASGKKASGLLMVDGVLFMWVRNAGNAQLAWSTDHAETWTWAEWRFATSFGCPTFLNFGRNYEGARDGYVYVYSQDAEDAYTPADRMVMARVPRDRIVEREAYEFFQGLDAAGGPVWTREIEQRGAVFRHPGRCYRSGISYNAGLRRYLWCQILPGGDTRFEGGFGIYDAPEPWGPWSTAFFTEAWDVGPGETCAFPTKWMSADGKTLHLVFSGDDYFSVRQAVSFLRHQELS